MKKIGKALFPIFFAFLAILNSFQAKGQKNEIGIGAGAMNYRGEIAPAFNPVFYRPGGNLFYRRNFNPAVSIRIPLTTGKIQANEFHGRTPVAAVRGMEFSSFITEFGVLLEYNFLDYRAGQESKRYRESLRFSPYLTGGVAMFNARGNRTENSVSGISIPIGMGIKYKLTEHLNLGFEFISRKTFTDMLDGVSEGIVRNRVTGIPNDTDWYYYTGISISYTFYSVICPEFYK